MPSPEYTEITLDRPHDATFGAQEGASALMCRACGSLVGDSHQHDAFHSLISSTLALLGQLQEKIDAYWIKTSEATPESGEIVEVITEGGHQTELMYHGPLWFLPDGSMYAYYTPMLWRRKNG